MLKSTKNSESGSVVMWAVVSLLGVVVLVLLFSTAKIVFRFFEVKNQVSQLQNEISSTAQENDTLQHKIDSQKDPYFLELQSRERFNYQLPGEHVFIFLEDTSSDKMANQNLWQKLGAWLESSKNNPASWIKYFIGQ